MNKYASRASRRKAKKQVTFYDLLYLFVFISILYGVSNVLFNMSLPSPKELQIKVHAEEITPSATPTPTQQETQDWEAFKKAAVLISKIYNYPANVVIAQCALESKHGTSEFARERNNYCGIGAVDDDPNQAYRFENQEQMLIYYMNMIKNNFGDTWDYRDNAETLLYKLENNSAGVVYASDPRYVSKVMNQQEWRQY